MVHSGHTGNYFFLNRFQFFAAHFHFPGKDVHISHPVHRYKVDMGMGHLKTNGNNINPVGPECFQNGIGHRLAKGQIAIKVFVGKIEQSVCFNLGHHKGMPFYRRKNIEKGKKPVIFSNLVTGYFAGNYF